MQYIKNFLLIFNHLNDYHMVLTILPFFLTKKNYKALYKICFGLAMAACILVLLKGSLKIPHPKYPKTFAFPSGHAWMVMSACYFIFKDNVKHWGLWVVVISIIELLVCIRGGHHELIDVFGGYSLGAIAIVLINIFNRFVKNIHFKTIFVVLFSVLVFLLIYFVSKAHLYAIGNLRAFIFYDTLTIIFYICSVFEKNKKI